MLVYEENGRSVNCDLVKITSASKKIAGFLNSGLFIPDSKKSQISKKYFCPAFGNEG
jgi:hypothetical protein